MKKTFLTAALASLSAASMMAQHIDFNNFGRPESEGLEPGYAAWPVSEQAAATRQFGDVTLTLRPDSARQGLCVMTKYWKQGVTSGRARLVGDGVCVFGPGRSALTEGSVRLDVVLTGLSAGRHSLEALHNNFEGLTAPPIDVYVDGERRLTGVGQTVRQTSAAASGQSYVTFTASEGRPVTVSYVTTPAEGTAYGTTTVTLNALTLDQPDSRTVASSPLPANHDEHADCDSGTALLQWSPGAGATAHLVYAGTSAEALTLVATTADTCHLLTSIDPAATYYWRVDERDAQGHVAQGPTWTFRPRRLAFPGAEGYGRYAIGGRGGTIYHVTSLADDAASPQPGTLRYGVSCLSGPRTIVFDVAGVITLQSRLTVAEKYVTLAGQTAPGRGIMLRGAPFGMASDGITRFLRMRLGYHGGNVNKGLDGLGMAGNDHSIMDHCSISWTIDEAFSSRNARHITLQRTLISEALNVADHPNYKAGKPHGFAATIGGGELGALGSTFHHNLLAHNEGRNWSLSGGLDAEGSYDGHHDVFNNVCYNWGGRATDGGTHEGQFVANFYKSGPATQQPFLLNAQIEGTGRGTQAYFVQGNIRQELDGTLTTDSLGVTYKYTLSPRQQLSWPVFVEKPFFPSHATVEPARQAFASVLSDVGCNQPELDNHDARMIAETLHGTTSTTGSQSGKPGLIDRETDAEGFDGLNIVSATRPADWDTDQDGIPDWFEAVVGTDPATANHNADRDADGYTDLEEYLDFMAVPHFTATAGRWTDVELAPYFAGLPQFEAAVVDSPLPAKARVKLRKGRLRVRGQRGQLIAVSVEARQTDGGIGVQRRFMIAVR